MQDNRAQESIIADVLADFLHDLKQPLNLVKVIAQDVRLDIKKNRLDFDTLPGSMAEIESAIDQLVSWIDDYREKVGE